MLSVLFPVHNAQGKLTAAVAEILEILAPWHGPFQLFILDDGSTDETAEEARELAACFPQVRLIRHPAQLGLAEAIQTGLDHTHGDVVLVNNEDYALEPEDLRTLWRSRDAQARTRKNASRRGAADPRLAQLLSWKPAAGNCRGFDVIPRQAFEEFRLSQAVEMMHRVDAPRTTSASIVLRREQEPKFLKMTGQLAE
jgi:glycosyltransferase involved in cell wall biosynthesis